MLYFAVYFTVVSYGKLVLNSVLLVSLQIGEDMKVLIINISLAFVKILLGESKIKAVKFFTRLS